MPAEACDKHSRIGLTGNAMLRGSSGAAGFALMTDTEMIASKIDIANV